MVFYLENDFPSSLSCPPDMADCTKLFHSPTTRRDIKLYFCNCSLLVCKEEIQSSVKSGSHTLPRLHMLFIYGSEIVAKHWCGKLAFKKILGGKKKKKRICLQEGWFCHCVVEWILSTKLLLFIFTALSSHPLKTIDFHGSTLWQA